MLDWLGARGARTGVAGVIAALAVAMSGGAWAQGNVLVMGADSAGGIVNAATSGVAKLLTEHSPYNVRVRTFSNPESWLPDLDAGRINLAVHFSATLWLVHTQTETNLKLPNLRLLRSSEARTPLGFMVRADSDIKSVPDLKGKRVTGGFGGQPILRRLAGGTLAAYGLDWSDVRMVPVPAPLEGAEALVDGRVDAAWYAVFAPATRDAHSKIGVRFLPIELTPERLQIAREKIFPGLVQVTVPGGNFAWAPPGTPLVGYPVYLAASAGTDDEVVTQVLETLWQHSEELQKVNPMLAAFTNESAVEDEPVIPYHPAAIEFYKGKDVWTAEAEAANAALPTP